MMAPTALGDRPVSHTRCSRGRVRQLLPLLLLATGCADPVGDGALRALTPRAAVAPTALDFGDQAVPVRATQAVVLSNAGRATLEVRLAVDGSDAFSLPVAAATLDPSTSVTLDVDFHPRTYLDFEATLRVLSNDETAPELSVPLRGVGVAAPVPALRLDPRTLDFGETDAALTELITATNTGTAPLLLLGVDQVGSGAFELRSDPAGNRLEPGASLPIVLRYAPEHTEGDSGQLLVRSNDPGDPEQAVVLLGNGGADFPYPEAHIACPGTTFPPSQVFLDGSGSRDPEGHLPLTYAWTIHDLPRDPAGQPISDARLTSSSGSSTQLVTDAVGPYEVRLVVTNALGTRSAPARCTVNAIPGEDLRVELTWDTARADLDLHLARNNAALFDVPDDVSWCNGAPFWGGGGADPRLDIDDQAGFGPENINVPDPAPGAYTVRVHYFDDHGDGDVTAAVRIYLLQDPTPAFQATRVLARNEVWDAAVVNWPAATVGALGGEPYPAPRRQCP